MKTTPLSLAETVTSSGIKSTYGDPIVIDGTTIVPVAAVQYGFGAGDTGSGDDGPNGSGGGGTSIPFGVYVSDDTGMHFRPNIITLLAIGIPFVWVSGRALSRIVRALKK